MNNINFEEDKTDILLDKSSNITTLSEEVKKMDNLTKEIEEIESTLK